MSEQTATKNFRTNLVSAGAHCQRIEDKLTEGVPDMNVSLDRVDFWAEGKFLDRLPARESTRIQFATGPKGKRRTAMQRNWLERRSKAGGLCFWWLRIKSGDMAGWYVFHELEAFDWLRDGMTRAELDYWADEGFRFSTVKEMVAWIREVLVRDHIEGI